MNEPPRGWAAGGPSDDDLAAAMFDHGAEPSVDDADANLFDEWAAALITARTFTPQRATHLGGPQERIVSAMPARTITIRRREVPDPSEDSQVTRAPSDEERARTARRTTEAQPERESPGMVLALLALLIGLVTFFVVLFVNRLPS